MTVLEKSARNQLDKAVQAARRAATAGADRALRALSVDQGKKPTYLTPEQNELRRRLRVRCRGFGSWQDLVRAVAYEQWHRMLFARFLAENDLLIHPLYQVPVTLDECAEIARNRGIDQWEVVTEYAAGMLPGIFQQDDPLLLLKYAPEDQAALQEILEGIPTETFQTQDALGWTYQFWQTEEKEKVKKSERKIEGADICAVTQLFTEPYMVQFLLQNTLGAWWLDCHPESPLRSEWIYYKDEVQHNFSTFPKKAKELWLLDPACGSGHFLVEAFHMLLAIRQEEGESRNEAIRGIVRDNLHGLELDPRCIQIAAFAIAMEAWKAGFPTNQYLPLPNLACVGLPIRAEKAEWLKLAAGDGLLEDELEKYYDLFKNADSLGSLIQIEETGTLVPADVLMNKLETALAKEKAISDPVAEAFGETASGILKAVQYLRRKDYHIVVTNPPFLSNRRQADSLRPVIERDFPSSKYDLSTVFIGRSKLFCCARGLFGLVSPQNWLFLTSYHKMRNELLQSQCVKIICRLGPNAFEEISGHIVKAILIVSSNMDPEYNSSILTMDVSEIKETHEKSNGLSNQNFQIVNQIEQSKNPDSRIVLTTVSAGPLLEEYSDCYVGVLNGDSPRFQRRFWEIPKLDDLWVFQQTTVEKNIPFGGQYMILFFDIKEGHLREDARIRREKLHNSDQRGNKCWGKWGVAVSAMEPLPVALYTGATFDSNVAILLPKDIRNLLPIWTFCQSKEYHAAVRQIDQSLKVTNATLGKVPFNLDHWIKVASEQYPNGLPKPYSDDPTQWLFHGHPKPSATPLHVSIVGLLGYRWPAEIDPTVELSSMAKKWIAESEKLLLFAKSDGIVCIPPVWGERPATERLRSILAAAYGGDWSPRKEEEILKQAGYTKNSGLEGFLRDEFFASHCKLFHHRPFIWQVWDGTKDGFSVLLNYHRLDRNALQKLIYTYLGNWIAQQKDEIRQEKPGSERRLAAAENLKGKLEKILEGEPPFDIYVRWKPLHEQAMGWEPDLNDGVRMNIRPFMEAGILRWKPNIKWGKDRGTDSVPNCSGTTERLNDLHFKLEEKQKARENTGEMREADQCILLVEEKQKARKNAGKIA
ncbi:SAM-dependent DNA methyltransferase [Methanofollis formosanus]|uniref:site-specific DNA-methyltransferase (adenine-specific) n=1 Tax=Methanofollis formosanus TaxID=299308 RepID=A0A8G1A1D3_9EURY|nr:N-6 DNA methylase [Methanofollis formosanus]QYZ78641.1 SAM-dependent DNA methyltransferase [Methanofollis formosanus]